MIDLGNPLVTLKITSAVCSFVAVWTTLHRLYIRRGRYWIDDGWAFFAFLCLLAQIAAVFMHVEDPRDLSRMGRVTAYYLMAETFYGVIWASRQAILYSIIRIDPNPKTRRVLYGVSALFGAATVFLMVQLFWICEPQQGWKDMDSPQCTLNQQVAICQLVSDIIADLILLLAPIRLLRALDDRRLRRKLMVIFSTCIVTTIVSLVHAAYILTGAGVKVVISAIVEDCMSLIVANLPVVVTQIINLREESASKRDPDVAPSTFMQFASKVFGRSSRRTTTTRGGFTRPGATVTTYKIDEEHSGDRTTRLSDSFGLSDGIKSHGSVSDPLPPLVVGKDRRVSEDSSFRLGLKRDEDHAV